jgi:hypothetical protein
MLVPAGTWEPTPLLKEPNRLGRRDRADGSRLGSVGYEPMRLDPWLAIAALASGAPGCAAFWPTVVPSAPSDSEPLFRTSVLIGGASLDGALCSLVTVGPEATLLWARAESTSGAVPLEQACSPAQLGAAERGQVKTLVRIETPSGRRFGHLFLAPRPRGLVVAFTGLGMPAAGWINERFAELAAADGAITFALVRDEAARPIYFDPLREARAALDAAASIRAACGVASPDALGFVGISMGGLEALLANREAHRRGMSARAAVLDPVLDVRLASANLDSFWHSMAVDSMQSYFRRILRGRYQEAPATTFREVMDRTRSQPGAVTDLEADVPSAWLCREKAEDYSVFLSDTDPVLGDAQRRFATACHFPLLKARVPGHTPLACRLALFQEMIAALRPRVALAQGGSPLPR